jgi:hypothetical protein
MAADDSGFPKLSAPARRALTNAGYTKLEQLITGRRPSWARCMGWAHRRSLGCASPRRSAD